MRSLAHHRLEDRQGLRAVSGTTHELRPASLLLLDEPTASLDARAEHGLFLRFRELARGRTTILVSHRFSTVAMADRIALLEAGCFAECGTHEELLARVGAYAALSDLHRRQLDGSGPAPAGGAAPVPRARARP